MHASVHSHLECMCAAEFILCDTICCEHKLQRWLALIGYLYCHASHSECCNTWYTQLKYNSTAYTYCIMYNIHQV
jgi:hypothetical protein